MRTVHDLETAFTDLADTAPDVDVLSVPTSAARRPLRRTLAPAAAALVTAAVIGGVLVATVPDDDRTAPAADSVAALPYPAADGPADTTFRFTAHLLGTEPTVRGYSVDRGGQRLDFFTPPSGKRCALSGRRGELDPNCRRVSAVTLLYKGRPTSSDGGTFDPDRLTDRVRQDVDGRRGYYGQLGSGIAGPELAADLGSVHLYWQYAPGAWADALAPTRAQALALARSVRPAQRRLAVPVELKPRAHQYLNTIDVELSSVGGTYEITSKDAKHGSARVAWGSGRDIKVGDVVDLKGVQIAGRTWVFYHLNGRIEAQLKNSATPIAISGDLDMSLATLRAYLERVRFARDPTDRSTWFAASTLR